MLIEKRAIKAVRQFVFARFLQYIIFIKPRLASQERRNDREATRRGQNFNSRHDIRFQLNPTIRALNEKCAGNFPLEALFSFSGNDYCLADALVHLSRKAVVSYGFIKGYAHVPSEWRRWISKANPLARSQVFHSVRSRFRLCSVFNSR